MEGMSDYLGHVFEDVCSEYFRQSYRNVGTWWGTDARRRTKEEIDIVAIGNGHMLLCECKYRSEPMGKNSLETLLRRSTLVKNSLPKKLCAVSKTGFTEEAIKTALENEITLYTMGDITLSNR